MNLTILFRRATCLVSILTAILWSGSLQAATFKVDPQMKLQTVEGWGVSLCCWAGQCGKWDEAKMDSIVHWLVDSHGLNYNVFRYNIGGGDDPKNQHCDAHHMGKGKGLRAEMDGFKATADAPYNWNADEAQRRIMLKIRKLRPDAIFEAFSNTPPYFMTVSGCAAGNDDANKDNLKLDEYEAFAQYLVDVCKHYKEAYNLTFYSLEPFNEPMTAYWNRNGSQEGCHFDVASMQRFIRVLAPRLRESGLKTRLAVSDETSVKQSVEDFEAFLKEDETFQCIQQWNTHSYEADKASRIRLGALAREHNMPLWMSETGCGGQGLKGNLDLSQRLIDDMKQMQPTVWCDWQAMEENNDQWCTVRGSFDGSRFWKVKNYYIRQHVTRFIRQGSTILSAGDEHSLVAYDKKYKELVIVCQNNSDNVQEYTADLSIFRKVGAQAKSYLTDEQNNCQQQEPQRIQEKQLHYVLQPQSIRTFIIRAN